MDLQRRRAWFALSVLFAINMMNFYDRQILAVLNEPIRKEWGLTDFKMGVLNTAFTLIYAAVGVPLGRISDRTSRTRVLAVGVSVWSVLTAATGAAWSFVSMFAIRLGVGVGEASCAPAANSLVGDLFPPKARARALAIMMLGLPIGVFLTANVSGVVAKHYGWRTAFFVACVPGIALGLLMLLVREPRRGGTEERAAARQPARPLHRPGSPYLLVLGTPTMLWIIITGALHNFNMYAVMGFLQALMQRYHRLDLDKAAMLSSVVLGAVGIVGLLAGGWICDRFQRTRPNGRLLVAAYAMLLSVPCLYFGLAQPRGSIAPFVALMGAGLMFMYVYYAGVYSAIQDVIEPGLRATAMALYFCAMYVVGGSFGSSVIGYLSDRFATQAMGDAGESLINGQIPEQFRALGLHSALYLVPILCLALAGALFAAARTVTADMKKLALWYEQSAAAVPGAPDLPLGELVPET